MEWDGIRMRIGMGIRMGMGMGWNGIRNCTYIFYATYIFMGWDGMGSDWICNSTYISYVTYISYGIMPFKDGICNST